MTELANEISDVIWADINEDESFPNKRTLLAHYTSVQTAKDILTGKQLWLANPLIMNDSEELKFGILEGAKAFIESEELRKAGEQKNCYDALVHSFSEFMEQMNTHDAFDIYIFCFSQHEQDDYDGKLSMWRGYGINGAGAALIFDTNKIEPVDDSPLALAPVIYATKEDRLKWIHKKIEELANLILDVKFDPTHTHELAWNFFARLTMFALHTKHKGFEEEKEWRLTYIKKFDSDNLAKNMLDYFIGPNGIEPKLKLDLATGSGLIAENFKIENTIDRIILGPTAASPLSQRAFTRALERANLDILKDKIHSSDIPYRAR